jgi:hypothetical protein
MEIKIEKKPIDITVITLNIDPQDKMILKNFFHFNKKIKINIRKDAEFQALSFYHIENKN